MTASKNDRHCPALNEMISSLRCGSERETKMACPATCLHSPYAIGNYDKGLLLTQKIVHQILSFIKAEVDLAEMRQLTERAHLEGKKAPSSPG